jgi:hypothetical protein
MFVVNNKDQFKLNSELYSSNTRYNNKFHYPTCKLTVFKKGVYYLGIKVFIWLPPNIRNLAQEVKHFKTMLRRFLLSNSFYSLEEYFDCKFVSKKLTMDYYCIQYVRNFTIVILCITIRISMTSSLSYVADLWNVNK